MKPPGRDPEQTRDLKAAALLSTVGLTLALSIAIGAGMGYLVDQRFRTQGLAVIGGTLLGIIAGFQQLIKAVLAANREQERVEQENKKVAQPTGAPSAAPEVEVEEADGPEDRWGLTALDREFGLGNAEKHRKEQDE
jgi:F0F1-type ATP synthase assembly protein I